MVVPQNEFPERNFVEAELQRLGSLRGLLGAEVLGQQVQMIGSWLEPVEV